MSMQCCHLSQTLEMRNAYPLICSLHTLNCKRSRVWFCCDIRRGLIMGLWNSHTSVGNILGSLIAGYYVSSNWGLSFIVPGVIIAVMGVICFFFLIERKWIWPLFMTSIYLLFICECVSGCKFDTKRCSRWLMGFWCERFCISRP